ncbi:MAG: hypothetical protein E4H14_01130 [Candidatus Thorarchaeota archaeon]|nr:MAG: hypothetical protein E4H14_01130 [Candidatus Thorarchaeota archaeon]
MADPRVNLVKPCPPSYLGKASAQIGDSAASRRNFTNAANKVGNLEILNSVGAGKIGQGLRTLASISNSIRQGCGSLPTSIGGALGAVVDGAEAAFTSGTDWALNQMGLDIKTVDAVRAFQPAIANQALGQAKQIYNQVRQGGFKYTDIPGYLQDFQNLERLGRNIFTPGAFDRNEQLSPQCEASPYALDLIARAPKHKFMFIVQFVPKNGYESLQDLNAAFMVFESSRPDIRYQMEDINYYNFRSKIITKTEFEPMNMKLYDDNLNAAGKFHAAILKALTPIANYPTPAEFSSPEFEGMDFANTSAPPITGVTFPGRKYSASTNNLLNSNTTIFNEIILYHLFDAGRVLNVYRFYNPRISNLKLDDLTMTESAVTSVDLTFAYDTVYIDTDVPFNGTNLGRSAQAASAGIGGSALYSLKYIDSPGAAAGPNNAGLLPGQPVVPKNNCDTAIQNNNPTSPPAASTPGGNTSASPAAQQDPFLASGPL